MGTSRTLPFVGIALAVVTFVAMLSLGLDPMIAIAVTVLWIGSLLLATGRPPEEPQVVTRQPISRRSIRKLIENSSTPVLVADKNVIAIANRTARDLMGSHVVGQDARVAFRHPEAIALFSENRNGTATIQGLVRWQDIWQINRQAIDEDLAVIELINQSAEADISRAHTDFVANASHELRTPLAAILGYVETLREDAGNLDASTSQKFLQTMEREAQRMHSLISDLMSLSRVEAEKHDLPRDVFDLRALVERAARDAAGSERVGRLSLELAADLHVQGDEKQLEQMVRNLVDNALKYGNLETSVKVELAVGRDSMARLSVIDQGEGIAPDQLPHLTRRFYRTDPGRSRASGGTGLGLAIVKHIVQRHRGRLNINSELGKGTSVIVRLPIATNGASSLSNPAIADSSRQEIDANSAKLGIES